MPFGRFFARIFSRNLRSAIGRVSSRATKGTGAIHFGSRVLASIAVGGVAAFIVAKGDVQAVAEEKELHEAVIPVGEDADKPPPGPQKKRLVVLGSGWAAMKFLKDLDTELYDVAVVSPRNYFLFTPLLPSTTVGTLDFRSIVEPVRKYCKRTSSRAVFYEATCEDIDFDKKTLFCREAVNVGHPDHTFTLPYDYLVVAVGAVNNTFNTPGVPKYTHFLKEIEDAQAIRDKLMDCLEAAALPVHTDEERKRLLSFLVVGGGPTGVEFAAELHDFIHEDLKKWYHALMPETKIVLVQSGDHILNTYDAQISKYAEEHFARENIEVLVNTRVLEVKEREVVVKNKTLNVQQNIPFGLCVWATGLGQNPLVGKICKKVPKQNHQKVLVVDDWLRMKGVDGVWAMGDCATIELKKAMSEFKELFNEGDTNKDNRLSLDELRVLLSNVKTRHPHLALHIKTLNKLFEDVDINHDGVLDLEEFKALLKVVDSKLTSLPATAQVASQEGQYLAKMFNDIGKGSDINSMPSFKYSHFGSFAYIGSSSAVLDFRRFNMMGLFAYFGWRTAYWTSQLSLRNMVFLSTDWTRTMLFGRDISRF